MSQGCHGILQIPIHQADGLPDPHRSQADSPGLPFCPDIVTLAYRKLGGHKRLGLFRGKFTGNPYNPLYLMGKSMVSCIP